MRYVDYDKCRGCLKCVIVCEHGAIEVISIEEGKLADIVVLSQDPYKINPEKIKDILVEMTIVNGEIEFTRSEQVTDS